MSKEQKIKEQMEAFDEAYLRENAALLAMTEEVREKYIANTIEVICTEILRIITLDTNTLPEKINQAGAAKTLLSSLTPEAPSLMSTFMWLLKPQYQVLIIKTLQNLSKKEQP